jgi:2-hydroxy-3-oxopropionate reductase
MAEVMGIDRQAVYDVLAAGPNRSGMMDFVKAYALDNDPLQLAFAVKNGAKDVGYYMQMARDAGVDSIMAKCPLHGLSLAMEDGRSEDMVPQMVDFYSARYQVEK